MPRHVNLLFQGGGVKGIAYAGVLADKPPDCLVNAVAGTSAGAIAAAFVALGYPADELKELLSDPKLFSLLSQSERARTQRIERAMADVPAVLDAISAGVGWKIWKIRPILRLLRTHKQAFKDLADVWQTRGLHSTIDLRDWLDEHLKVRDGPRKGERARFDDIVVDDLKIVVADVTNRQFKVFERRLYGGDLIANAVHASVSIPVFFIPFLSGAGTESFVDGGILSNYPSFLFAQSEYKTIGFRFSDVKRPGRLASTLDYLSSLLFTMTDAHDKLRGDPPRFVSYEIPTTIPATKFDLSPDEAAVVYKAGRDVAKIVDWQTHSSVRPEISFYDERPHDVLQSSLTQAFKLMDKYGDPAFWVQSLDTEVIVTFRIERDWTVRYVMWERLSVGGPERLFFSRLRARWDRAVPFGKSLAELEYSIREVVNGTENDVIHVPALNKEASKAFLMFFTPPIGDGQPREFRTEYSVPGEFARTVGKGKSDVVSYAAFQNAKTQTLTLRIRVLADTELPHLEYQPRGGLVAVTRTAFDEQGSGPAARKYTGWEWAVDRLPVIKDVGFELEVGLL